MAYSTGGIPLETKKPLYCSCRLHSKQCSDLLEELLCVLVRVSLQHTPSLHKWNFFFANITWFSSVKGGRSSVPVPASCCFSWPGWSPLLPSCFLVLFQASLTGESPGNSNPAPVISSLRPQRREGGRPRWSFWMWRTSWELQGDWEKEGEGQISLSCVWGVDLAKQLLSRACKVPSRSHKVTTDTQRRHSAALFILTLSPSLTPPILFYYY